MSTNTLIQGTLILTVAALFNRVLGVGQRIPLQHILGDEGMATYGIAYNIYGILLILATVGIPSALSKQIAEYQAAGLYREGEATYRAARDFSIVSGVVTALLLFWAAPYYAIYVSHDPVAVLAIQAIAPALLLFPLIAVLRGYFQGRQTMMPTGLSQMLEQILRVATALALPLLLLAAGYSAEVAVAGASFGAVTGSIGALTVVIYYLWRTNPQRTRRVRGQTPGNPVSRRRIYATLLKTAIPISLASTAVPFLYFIDSSTVIALLKSSTGYAEAKILLGILIGRAQSLAGIPPILAIAVSSAVLPAVASAYSRRDLGQVQRTSALALRLTLLTGAPVALYLCAAALPVNGFLFSDAEGSLVIAVFTFASIFQMLMLTSMAILQGVGNASAVMRHVGVGLLVKLAGNFVLAMVLGIYGILLATLLSFLTILLLNTRSIRRVVTFRLLGARWRGFLLASVTLFVPVLAIALLLPGMLPGIWPAFVQYGITALVAALLGFPLYALVLYWAGGIDEEDIASLPRSVQRWLPHRRPSA
jgi:stage V sporulation protein B